MWPLLLTVEALYILASTVCSLAFRNSPWEGEIARTIARWITLIAYVPIFLIHFRKPRRVGELSSPRTLVLVTLSMATMLLLPVLFQRSNFTGPLQGLWFAASFVVGFREEIFYRGIVQQTLVARYGLTRSLLITAVLFTAYHVSYFIFGWWPSLIEVFLFSLAVGVIYWKTKSIVLVALFHGVYDAVPFLTPWNWLGVPESWGLLFLVTGVIFAALLLRKRSLCGILRRR